MHESLYLCFLMIIGHASANCQLGNAQMTQTNRIFANRTQSQLDLLRLDSLPTDTKLDMICSRSDILQMICQENGSWMSLPLNKCSKPPKPTVVEFKDSSCPFVMYRVGYELSDDQFLELYRSCYDVRRQTAHYVVHLAFPITLPTARPQQAFTTDGIISGAAAATFQGKRIYDRFQALLGPQQSYVRSVSDLVFDRGHLAPSADFGFESYMQLSFKYLNVVAQFRGINRSNWKTIENWIRNQLHKGNFQKLHICTGGLGVLELLDSSGHLKEIYLNAPDKNPIPKWLFKVVNDGAGTRYAFVTYNNIHDTKVPTPPNCNKSKCPASLQLLSTKEAGITFCCDPIQFLTGNLPYLSTVC